MISEIQYGPYPHQIPFHEDNHRFRIITGGRRSGKSECAVQELIVHAISTPGGLSWYLAPTYNDAYEIGFEKFMEHFDVLEPAIRTVNYTKLRVIWTNGHTTYFKGAENQKSLRGRGLTFAVLDEVAFMDEDVWKKIVRPALMDNKGSAILLTTPNGRNWFYGLWQKALNLKDTERWHWTTMNNPTIDEDEIESARESMSKNDFDQEILAKFVTKAGMVYSDFSDDNIKTISDDTYKALDVSVGIDFGYANPSSFSFMAYNSANDQVYQFDEIYKERTTIEQLTMEMDSILQSYGIDKKNVTLFTDPAGNAAELSSGISPVDFLRKAGYVVKNKGTEIAPGLALVRRFICNAKGDRSYYIHPRCKETIRSLQGYTYPVNKTNKYDVKEVPLKDGIHDHVADSVRYYFVNRFDHAKYIAYRPDVTDYTRKPKIVPYMKRCIKCRKSFMSKTLRSEPPHMCPECLSK